MALAPIPISGRALTPDITGGIQRGQQINTLQAQQAAFQGQEARAQQEAQQLAQQQQRAVEFAGAASGGQAVESIPDFAKVIVENPQLIKDLQASAGITNQRQSDRLGILGIQLRQLQGDRPAQNQLIEAHIQGFADRGEPPPKDTIALRNANDKQRAQFAAGAILQGLNAKEIADLAGKSRPSLQAVAPAEGGGFIGIDPASRESVFVPPPAGKRTQKQADAERKAQEDRVTKDIKGTDEVFKRAEKLRAEIFKASTEFEKLDSAFGRIQASSEDPSAAGDIALIFNFMKMLDPGSVVREGEFATAAQATGVPGRILNQYNKLITGERLAPKQRTDFLNQSKNIFDRAQVDNTKAVNKLVDIGEQFGVARDQLLGRQQQPARNLVDLTAEDLANLSDEELQALAGGTQ